MKQTLIRLSESEQPAMTPENALREALRIADLITSDDAFLPPGYMNGHTGTSVFLCAALPFLQKPEACRSFLERSFQELSGAVDVLRHSDTADLSLASGLSGSIHALLQLYRMTGRSDYADLLDPMTGLLLERLPSGSLYQDLYLGISGCILVLSELLTDGEALPFFTAERKKETAACLMRCMNQLLSMRTNRPISGLGHGMAGIAYALLRGVSVLSEIQADVPQVDLPEADPALMSHLLQAAKDALHFEIRTYNAGIQEWPDLRPKGGPDRTLHGICSGAPGIGLGLMRYSGISDSDPEPVKVVSNYVKEETDILLGLVRDACLHAELRDSDHLCCGLTSLAEYLLESGKITGSQNAVTDTGKLLAFMYAQRQERGSAFYRLPQVVQEKDPSLFFGLAGIGLAFLRYAVYSSRPSSDSMPVLLPL